MAPADPASVEPRFGNYRNTNAKQLPTGFMPVARGFENYGADLHRHKRHSRLPTELGAHVFWRQQPNPDHEWLAELKAATPTSRITVTTTTASVLRVPCHAGIRRVTPAESARVSSPSLSCVGSILPRKQQTRSGQIKNQPGGSGRPQGSNAPPGVFVADGANRSGAQRLVSFRSISA